MTLYDKIQYDIVSLVQSSMVVLFLIFYYGDYMIIKWHNDLSRDNTTQCSAAQWLETGQIIIHRQIMHVHCSLKLQSMSHFAGAVVWKWSANIFLAYKADYTVQQLMKQSQAVWNTISTWIIHCPVCFYKALGHDIHGNFLLVS